MNKIASVVLCRVWFCPLCYEANRPHQHDKFITIGSKHKIDFHEADWNGIRGFTPHLITLHDIDQKTVQIGITCCMNGCGILILPQRASGMFQMPEILRCEFKLLTIRDWRALKRFKDEDYRID